MWDFPGSPEVRFYAPNAGGPGSIPSQGARFYTLQPELACHSEDQRSCVPQLRPGTAKSINQLIFIKKATVNKVWTLVIIRITGSLIVAKVQY